MQISLETGAATFRIVGYGTGFVTVNEERFERSFWVRPETLESSWPPQRIEELDADHVRALAEAGAEIVIIGTGERQVFPATEVMAPLVDAAIGFEIMDTRAACRTFNILMAEGRDVLAAIMII